MRGDPHSGWINEFRDGRMDGWMGGWIDGWMDGRVNRWKDGHPIAKAIALMEKQKVSVLTRSSTCKKCKYNLYWKVLNRRDSLCSFACCADLLVLVIHLKALSHDAIRGDVLPHLKAKHVKQLKNQLLSTILANRLTSSMSIAGNENWSGLLQRRVKFRNTWSECIWRRFRIEFAIVWLHIGGFFDLMKLGHLRDKAVERVKDIVFSHLGCLVMNSHKSIEKKNNQELVDAEVLLKSQIKFRVPIAHYHWAAALNYCIHLQHRSIRNQFGLCRLHNFL